MVTRSPWGSANFISDSTLLQIVDLQNIILQSVVADNFLLHILQIGMKDNLLKTVQIVILDNFFFVQIVASDKFFTNWDNFFCS